MGNIKINHQKLVGGSSLAANDAIKFFNSSEKDIQYLDLAGLTNYMESNINAENLGLTSYTDYFRGNFADAAAMPGFATLGQWLIRTDTDTIWVWDQETTDWKETGAGSGGQLDTEYVFVYNSNDGSGYGFTDASSINGTSYWNNTPDGRLQATAGGSSENFNRVRFGTLVNPGDEVILDGIGPSDHYITRWSMVGLSKGADPATTFKNTNQGITSSLSGYGTAANAGNGFVGIEFHNCYVKPYWGTSSYAANMNSIGGANPVPADSNNMVVGYRMASDYHIEFLVDGVVRGRTQRAPSAGVDLYIQCGYTLDFPQPTGALVNNPTNTNAASGSASKFWMSTDGTPSGAVQMALGEGYYLYSRDTAGDVHDIELSAEEAAASLFSRPFVDYSAMSFSEVAAATKPIIDVDREVLTGVEDLFRGWYHSKNYDVATIGAKLGIWSQALQAAAAGSVELTVANISAVSIASLDADEQAMRAQGLADLSLHLAKFPR